MNRWTGAAAMLALATTLFGCGARDAVSAPTLAPTTITPNADGKDDVASITYRVNEAATVDIYLSDATGKRFALRRSEERTPSPAPYQLLFSGVSNGRLVPDGAYTWHLDATAQGRTQSFSGTLLIRDGQQAFPAIKDFTISSKVLSPNRDAIDDHVYVGMYLTARAKLSVFVEGPNGYHFDVPRREGNLLRPQTELEVLDPGRYEFDYDGGINSNAEPPPDGNYVLVAQSEDKIGQRSVVTAPISLVESGRPAAEITIQPLDGNGVSWSRTGSLVTMQLGDVMYFTASVQNVGTVPIRTAGPFVGADCYSMTDNWYTKGFRQEPGIFRVGLDYDSNPGADHPFRWGVGSLQNLTKVERDGNTLYYLPVGAQSVVQGCVRFDKVPVRNPFNLWAALIQEDVEVVNDHVTPVLIQLVTK